MKFYGNGIPPLETGRPPHGGRGLKFLMPSLLGAQPIVAPHTGGVG